MLLHRHGAERAGGHGAALPFRTGPGLGVTLTVAALQREVLWPWAGLTPPPPSGARGQPGKDPMEYAAAAPERGCGGMDPWLPSAGTCWFQRVDVLAWIPSG